MAQSTKLELLLTWATEMHQRMTETQWEGYYLTDSSIDYGLREVDNILRMN